MISQVQVSADNKPAFAALQVEPRSVRVDTEDGATLACSVFYPPQGEPSAVLLINGATGVRRKFYTRFAAHLANRGVAVVTYDYRGIGESLSDKPVSRYEATMLQWGSHDFPAVLARVQRKFPGLPVFGLGHSVGGQLFGLSPASAQLSGIVGVASQSGYWRLSPTRARMWLNWNVILPGLVQLFGYLPGWSGVGADLPKGIALEWARWCRSPHFFVDERGRPLELYFGQIESPVLWYTIERDPFAPAAAVEWIARHMTRASVERRTLAGARFGTGPIGHFKLFTPRYTEAWNEIADWVMARAARSAQLS